jgi:signal peptidase I
MSDITFANAYIQRMNRISKDRLFKSLDQSLGHFKMIHQENSLLWELFNLILKIAIITATFALFSTCLFGFCRNTDPDMVPMVKDGDLVLFYRLNRDYSFGDLLLLNYQGKSQVRRVVAKAGDTVDITENGLSINGAIQRELDIYQPTQQYEDGVPFPYTVPEGQVFILGDARENATDSRVYGAINTEDTLGSVIAVLRRRNI